MRYHHLLGAGAVLGVVLALGWAARPGASPCRHADRAQPTAGAGRDAAAIPDLVARLADPGVTTGA